MGRHGSKANPAMCTITVKPFQNSKGSLLDRRSGPVDTKLLRSGRKFSSYVAAKELVVFFN